MIITCYSIGGSASNLDSSRVSRPLAEEGAPRIQYPRLARTVSPPSAHVKRFAVPQGANLPFDRHSKRLSDRGSPFHHKDRNEKKNKTRRKKSMDYGDLQASPKSPSSNQNELEDIHSTVNNKIKKLDGASTPKFIKSRERAKRKAATTGSTKRKTPHKEWQTTVSPVSNEQQELNPNKPKWPAIDSTKQNRPATPTIHTERQQIATSPELTERRKRATSPDYTERHQTPTLFDDIKRRKPAGLPDQTEIGAPVTSPDHTERRKPTTSPDHAERGNLGASPGHTERRQPTTSPEAPDQRLAPTPKVGDKRGRRLVARGDSRAAAVAEAVADCSSNSAYPVWLRHR